MLEPQNNVPKLSEKQLLVLANYGTKIKVKANAVLINEGVKNFDFYVILKGKVAIYDPFNPKEPVAIHKKMDLREIVTCSLIGLQYLEQLH
ncbi:hypothetical protein M601_005965 [Cellulophaga baltica 4]|nr:hypothetical protein M601_005965 [Cellulophaga baltica 4]